MTRRLTALASAVMILAAVFLIARPILTTAGGDQTADTATPKSTEATDMTTANKPADSRAAAGAPVPHYAAVPANFKPTAIDAPPAGGGTTLKTATFGAGCFWGVEATFRQTNGVTHTAVGYLGGSLKNPTYKDVCTDATGHAEVVQVLYDPAKVTYDQLLQVFWDNHNPTTMNRQGPDYGTQYRSAIFFHDDEQKAAAIASRASLQSTDKYQGRKIVTEITPASAFYIAEDYHQQYLEKRGLSSCHVPQ